MAQIPPINDAYIDDIIKSSTEVYNPAVNKMQGVKLRELIKLMRDRSEQQSSGTSITGTVLTGLSTATNSPVVAADTILSAAGKLQAQATTRLTGTIATDAETQIIATVIEDNKFVSRLKLFNWWGWVKGQVQTITARWIFSILRFATGSSNSAPANGDVWNNNGFNFQFGSLLTKLLMTQGNPDLIGLGSRIIQTNSVGDISAVNNVNDWLIISPDVISAITAATFNSGNHYTASIVPAPNMPSVNAYSRLSVFPLRNFRSNTPAVALLYSAGTAPV